MGRLFLLDGFCFIHLRLGFSLELLSFLILLGCEFRDLVIQLRSLFLVVKFEFLHDVIILVLDVRDLLETVLFDCQDVIVEFSLEFVEVLGQRFDRSVSALKQFLVVGIESCERLFDVAGSRSAVE